MVELNSQWHLSALLDCEVSPECKPELQVKAGMAVH